MHALKFGGCERIAAVLGEIAGRRWIREGQLGGYAAIVPVPLSRKRRLRRGFNQAERIAQAVASLAAAELRPALLDKLGERPPQAGLSAAERKRNASGAYRASIPTALRGRDVLLVDDVFTTGATVEAAARALRRAGAGSVDVLTIARVR